MKKMQVLKLKDKKNDEIQNNSKIESSPHMVG